MLNKIQSKWVGWVSKPCGQMPNANQSGFGFYIQFFLGPSRCKGIVLLHLSTLPKTICAPEQLELKNCVFLFLKELLLHSSIWSFKNYSMPWKLSHSQHKIVQSHRRGDHLGDGCYLKGIRRWELWSMSAIGPQKSRSCQGWFSHW